MKKNRLETFYIAEIFIYVMTVIFSLVFNFMNHDMNQFMMTFVAIITPFLVPLGFKLIGWKMTSEVKIANITFIYFASLVGSGLGGYNYLGFDKVLHFTSGIFGIEFAIVLFHMLVGHLEVDNPKEYKLYLIFINAVNLAIAVLWEFYEFCMLIFFNNDCINHYTTGVFDSITDMMCAFFAGLIITFFVHKYQQNKKENFFISLYKNLYKENSSHQ